MATLNIEGRSVKVDDSFLRLSAEEQNKAVEEIAASLKIGAQAKSETPAADAPVGLNDVVRATARGVPILGGALDKANAATNAALAPLIEPFLDKGPDTLDQPTFGERYDKSLKIQRGMDKKFDEESPIVSTAAKVAGGVGALIPAIAAAPAAFGATGTMGQMVSRGALSGGALSAADAAVRGDPVVEATGIGAITGAAGGPLGKAIGKVAEKIASRGDVPVPQNTMNVAGVDVTLPPTDPKAASTLEIARKGAAGDPAQQVVQGADAEVAAQLKQAQDNIAAQLDPTGASAGATPQAAAERVAAELATAEQARLATERAAVGRATAEAGQVRSTLATDPYTGQPLAMAETPFEAAEQIGAGVGRARDAAVRTRDANYAAVRETPGTFDESVPRGMAEELRVRLNRGDDPLWVDPQSTSKANEALKLIDQTIGEGLFANRAAPRPGAVRAGAGAAAPDAPEGAAVAAAVPSDAEIAFRKLIADGAEPEKARRAVANLPGADALPRGPMDRHTVATAAGGSVEVQPRVVEASSLKTSADPGYDQTLQPRNRARAASDLQIQDMAKNITPARLGVSAEADRGAPIIGADLMVESGNGRVLALRQAYQQGGAQADKYRAWLQSQGVDVSKFREPVLVRERVTPMSAEERKAFTVAANQSSTLSLSGAERALADARALTPDLLALIRNPDDLGAVGNREFIRQFMQSVPASERAALMTAKGDLSSEGLTRVRNAVMAKAYGNSSILARAAESTKDEVKSISTGLLAAAPEWAQLRAAVASGAVPKELDATVHLLDAVERTARIRGKGTSLAEGLAQSDAFTAQSPESEAFMRLFYSADGKSAASTGQVTNAVRHYAQEAAKVDAAPGLNLGMAPVTPRDILAVTSSKVGAPAALAEEVAAAAKASAVPPKAAAPITEIGLKEMDSARKRLVTMYADARKAAMGPGGSGSDMRAMGRILHEFDNVILDAFEAGRFSGDGATAQRLLREARQSHAIYRETFTSRGGSDPVGRSVEKILGRYADTAASPDEIARLSYGAAAEPGGGEAIRVAQRLRGILGPTSPEWGAFKQGLFEYVRGPETLTAAQQATRIEKYLTGTKGRGHANVVLSADERSAMATHARNLRASEPVPLGDLNSVDKKIRRIAGTDGHPPASIPEIITDLVGGVNTAGAKSVSIGLAKRLKRDMTPEGFGQVKQGVLSHLLTKPEGVKEMTHEAMVKSLSNFLNGSGTELSMVIYSAKELGDIRALRDAIKAQIPPGGTTNPSGTAPMLTKIAKGMAGWILPVLGFSHGGLVGAGVGVAATKGVSALANARAAREVKGLLYGKQPASVVDPRFAKAGALISRGATQGQLENR